MPYIETQTSTPDGFTPQLIFFNFRAFSKRQSAKTEPLVSTGICTKNRPTLWLSKKLSKNNACTVFVNIIAKGGMCLLGFIHFSRPEARVKLGGIAPRLPLQG
jgi:hypothetical protein